VNAPALSTRVSSKLSNNRGTRAPYVTGLSFQKSQLSDLKNAPR
jgi:hypothetical protein